MTRGETLYARLAILTLGAGLATSPTSIAQAQQSSGPATVVVPPPTPLKLKCCRCLEGPETIVDLNSGTVDWRVSGPGVKAGASAYTINSNLNGQWTARLKPARWIQPRNGNGGQLHPEGAYRYEVTVETPKYCTIPMSFIIEGSAAGDDEVKVFVDDFTTPIGYTPLSPAPGAGETGWGFTRERTIAYFGRLIGPGRHTLRVEVKNLSFGSHGVIVRARVRGTCPGRFST